MSDHVMHAAVLESLGHQRDARSHVRIAADLGLSDLAVLGYLRALENREFAKRTDTKPVYWTLTEKGEYVQALMREAAHSAEVKHGMRDRRR
jgi:predicted ArsR family transcriptional regulator